MAFLVQRSDVGEFRRRYRWMVLFVLAAFLVLVGRLAQLQLFEGEIARIVDVVVHVVGGGRSMETAQNVDTSSATTSSTRMVSVVKKGSP